MTLGVDLSGPQTGNGAAPAAPSLSMVVPVYNEAAGLAHLHERLVALAPTLKQRHGLRCEVIYVDDGSADDTLAIARGLNATALDVQVVSLSRNFGKEAALMAGLDYAGRGAVLFMDGDGQHPPALVEQLVRALDRSTATTWSIPPRRIATMNPGCGARPCTASTRCSIGAPGRTSRRTPAISGCCRRARPRRCGGCPSATASSRGWRAGSASARSASTTSRRRAPTASPPSTPRG